MLEKKVKYLLKKNTKELSRFLCGCTINYYYMEEHGLKLKKKKIFNVSIGHLIRWWSRYVAGTVPASC